MENTRNLHENEGMSQVMTPADSRRRRIILILAIVSICLVTATNVFAQAPKAGGNDIVQEGTNGDGKLRLTVNKSAVITTRVPYKQVSVGQPEIADVNTIGPSNILVTAKKAGTTQIIIWDDANRSQVIDVTVEFDLQALQDQLRVMFPGSKLEVTSVGNSIALRGRVPSLSIAEQATALVAPYSEKVLNFTEIAGGQQVMLQVRFAEVSRSATSALGVNLAFTDGVSFGASNIGQVNPFALGAGLLPGAVTPTVTQFGRAQIGSTTIDVFVNALRQNNLLRILAEPNLMATSGQEANFLAGGEFPIPVTQGGGTGAGGTAITIEYREFGVRLRMVPVVLGDGRIRLKVAPEVSDLDFTTAVRFNGFVIPGLTSRKLDTTIELNEGQTFAIAGLLNHTVTSNKDVTPLLGDLPVVGALFRSVRYQRKETELVVLVTPRLVDAMNPGQIPSLPGEYWRHPTEIDLFLNQDIGGEAAGPGTTGTTKVVASGDSTPAVATATGDAPATAPAAANRGPAPLFHGDFGFVPTTQPVANTESGEMDR